MVFSNTRFDSSSCFYDGGGDDDDDDDRGLVKIRVGFGGRVRDARGGGLTAWASSVGRSTVLTEDFDDSSTNSTCNSG